MEKIAFIYGGTFIYWSSIILSLAAVAAIAIFAAHEGFAPSQIVPDRMATAFTSVWAIS